MLSTTAQTGMDQYYAAPLRYKKWVKKYYWKLHDFVEDGYQNPDYDKTVESDAFGDVWIKFTAKEA